MEPTITVTDEAAEVLRRSLALADVDPDTGGVRLRGSKPLGGGFHVQVELAEGPLEGDESMRFGDLNVFVDPAVGAAYPTAVVTVEPEHETIVVRPTEPGAP